MTKRRKPAQTLEQLLKQMDRNAAVTKVAKRKIRRSLYRRAVRWSGRRVWMGRRHVGLLYAAGVLLLAAQFLSGRSAALPAVAICGVVTALVVFAAGRSRGWPNFHSLFLLAAVLYGAGWLAAVTVIGAGTPMPGVLIAATMVGLVPWWIKLSSFALAEAPAEPAVEIDDRLAQFEATAPGNYLPKGTSLHSLNAVELDDDADGTPDMLGWSGILQLPPGAQQTYENLPAVLPNLAATWRVPTASVMLELTESQVPDSAKVTVLTRRNPAHEVNYFDRSWIVMRDGCFPYGVFPDGQKSWQRLYEPGSGPVHSLVSGDTRSGKSSTVSLMITQATFTGFCVPFVGDPQGGQSMPEWVGPQGRAKWIAWDESEIWLQTNAIMQLMVSRNQRITAMKWTDEDGVGRQGYSFFDPDVITDLPILDWTLDEAHNMLRDDNYAELLAQIVKMASKCGVRCNIITQYPAASPDLGGRMDLRNQLAAGNLVCHRNSTHAVKGMLLPEGFPSPFAIPKVTPKGEHTKGSNVSFSPAPFGDRAAVQRTARVQNPFKWADLAVEQIRRPLTKEDEDSMGDDYAKRWERFAARDSTPVVIDMATRQDTPTPVVAITPAYQTAGDRIVAYLAEHGKTRSAVIARNLDMPLPTASTTLGRLAEKGLVVKIRQGEWTHPQHTEALEYA